MSCLNRKAGGCCQVYSPNYCSYFQAQSQFCDPHSIGFDCALWNSQWVFGCCSAKKLFKYRESSLIERKSFSKRVNEERAKDQFKNKKSRKGNRKRDLNIMFNALENICDPKKCKNQCDLKCGKCGKPEEKTSQNEPNKKKIKTVTEKPKSKATSPERSASKPVIKERPKTSCCEQCACKSKQFTEMEICDMFANLLVEKFKSLEFANRMIDAKPLSNKNSPCCSDCSCYNCSCRDSTGLEDVMSQIGMASAALIKERVSNSTSSAHKKSRRSKDLLPIGSSPMSQINTPRRYKLSIEEKLLIDKGTSTMKAKQMSNMQLDNLLKQLYGDIDDEGGSSIDNNDMLSKQSLLSEEEMISATIFNKSDNVDRDKAQAKSQTEGNIRERKSVEDETTSLAKAPSPVAADNLAQNPKRNSSPDYVDTRPSTARRSSTNLERISLRDNTLLTKPFDSEPDNNNIPKIKSNNRNIILSKQDKDMQTSDLDMPSDHQDKRQSSRSCQTSDFDLDESDLYNNEVHNSFLLSISMTEKDVSLQTSIERKSSSYNRSSRGESKSVMEKASEIEGNSTPAIRPLQSKRKSTSDKRPSEVGEKSALGSRPSRSERQSVTANEPSGIEETSTLDNSPHRTERKSLTDKSPSDVEDKSTLESRPLESERNSVTDKRSSVNEKKSSPNGRTSQSERKSVTDKRSSVHEETSSPDSQSPQPERKSVTDKRPSVDEGKSSTDSQSPQPERTSATGKMLSIDVEHSSPDSPSRQSERKSTTDKRPSVVVEQSTPESRSHQSERKSVTGKRPSVVVEHSSPDSRSRQSERKSITDKRPSVVVEQSTPDSRSHQSERNSVTDKRPSVVVEKSTPYGRPYSSERKSVTDKRPSVVVEQSTLQSPLSSSKRNSTTDNRYSGIEDKSTLDNSPSRSERKTSTGNRPSVNEENFTRDSKRYRSEKTTTTANKATGTEENNTLDSKRYRSEQNYTPHSKANGTVHNSTLDIKSFRSDKKLTPNNRLAESVMKSSKDNRPTEFEKRPSTSKPLESDVKISLGRRQHSPFDRKSEPQHCDGEVCNIDRNAKTKLKSQHDQPKSTRSNEILEKKHHSIMPQLAEANATKSNRKKEPSADFENRTMNHASKDPNKHPSQHSKCDCACRRDAQLRHLASQPKSVYVDHAPKKYIDKDTSTFSFERKSSNRIPDIGDDQHEETSRTSVCVDERGSIHDCHSPNESFVRDGSGSSCCRNPPHQTVDRKSSNYSSCYHSMHPVEHSDCPSYIDFEKKASTCVFYRKHSTPDAFEKQFKLQHCDEETKSVHNDHSPNNYFDKTTSTFSFNRKISSTRRLPDHSKCQCASQEPARSYGSAVELQSYQHIEPLRHSTSDGFKTTSQSKHSPKTQHTNDSSINLDKTSSISKQSKQHNDISTTYKKHHFKKDDTFSASQQKNTPKFRKMCSDRLEGVKTTCMCSMNDNQAFLTTYDECICDIYPTTYHPCHVGGGHCRCNECMCTSHEHDSSQPTEHSSTQNKGSQCYYNAENGRHSDVIAYVTEPKPYAFLEAPRENWNPRKSHDNAEILNKSKTIAPSCCHRNSQNVGMRNECPYSSAGALRQYQNYFSNYQEQYNGRLQSYQNFKGIHRESCDPYDVAQANNLDEKIKFNANFRPHCPYGLIQSKGTGLRESENHSENSLNAITPYSQQGVEIVNVESIQAIPIENDKEASNESMSCYNVKESEKANAKTKKRKTKKKAK